MLNSYQPNIHVSSALFAHSNSFQHFKSYFSILRTPKPVIIANNYHMQNKRIMHETATVVKYIIPCLRSLTTQRFNLTLLQNVPNLVICKLYTHLYIIMIPRIYELPQIILDRRWKSKIFLLTISMICVMISFHNPSHSFN